MYVTTEEYRKLVKDVSLTDEELEILIRQAERDIDSITFYRIVKRGFENLTDFQQALVKEAVCLQGEYVFMYGDMINSPFNSYGINGVSMQFGKGTSGGTSGDNSVEPRVRALLLPTGLTNRGIY